MLTFSCSKTSAHSASLPLHATQHGQSTRRRLESLGQGRYGAEVWWTTAALGTKQAVNRLLASGVSKSVWDRSISVRN